MINRKIELPGTVRPSTRSKRNNCLFPMLNMSKLWKISESLSLKCINSWLRPNTRFNWKIKSKKHLRLIQNWQITTDGSQSFTAGSNPKITWISTKKISLWRYWDYPIAPSSRKATSSNRTSCWCSCSSSRKAQSNSPTVTTKPSSSSKD